MKLACLAVALAILTPLPALAEASPRTIANLESQARSDDRAEDALWRLISRWNWPRPRSPGRRKPALLDRLSLAFLHLGPAGAPFPLDLRDPALAEAARRVGRYAPPKAYLSLRSATMVLDPAVRAQAALALGWARDPGAEPFVERLLADPVPAVRARAADALGMLDDRAAVEKLIRALGDTSLAVRTAAARSLGRLGDSRAIQALEGLMIDGDPELRLAAWEALAALGGHGATSILRTALGDPAMRYPRTVLGSTSATGDSEPTIRRPATRAEIREMANRGADDEAIQRLAAASGKGANRDGLRILTGDLSDPDPALRRAACLALGASRDPLAAAALESALRDSDSQVRGLAAQGLGGIGNRRSVGPLLDALARGDARIAGVDQAGPSLVYLGDPLSQARLRSLVRVPHHAVAAAALLPLGRLGTDVDVPVALGALDHPDPGVRAAAARALGDLETVPLARQRELACGEWGHSRVLTDRDLRSGVNFGPAAGSPCAVRSLTDRLKDPSALVRINAAEALGRLADSRSFGGLYLATADPDRAVANAARLAIGQCGVDWAALPLDRAASRGSASGAQGLAAMAQPGSAIRIASLLDGKDSAARGQAAAALGILWTLGGPGTAGGSARLAEALFDPDRGVRVQAAMALGFLPGSGDGPLRRAVSESNPLVRPWAASALIRQRPAGAALGWNALAQAVASSDGEVRRTALEALAWLGSPQGGTLAATTLRDTDPAVRMAAVDALVASPGPIGREHLVRLVTWGRWSEAVRALEGISPRDPRAPYLVEAAPEHPDIRVRWAADRLVRRAERLAI